MRGLEMSSVINALGNSVPVPGLKPGPLMPTVRGPGGAGSGARLRHRLDRLRRTAAAAAAAFLLIAIVYGVVTVRRASIGVTVNRQVLPLQVFDGDHAVRR